MKNCFFVLFFLFANFLSAQNADIHWLRCINQPYNPQLDNAMKFTSNSVTPIIIGVPVGILTYDLICHSSMDEKRKPLVIFSALATTSVIAFGLKYSVNRPRPFVTYPDIIKKGYAGSKSFPSGHTSSAFALATSISLEYPKWYYIVPSYMWACTVGYSRMRLGVHYPSDVFAGAIIGAGCAWGCWWLNKKLFRPDIAAVGPD
ncbi:MAG TPA: phosphatase PAP2 family protein [Bacteroidia bacterium]|nr:phosphatase PAP2 family protein [Bacteroidia bacterium]